MSRANTSELVGAVAIVEDSPPKVLLPDKLWRITFLEKSEILPSFLLHALRQPSIRRIIGVLATGTSGSMKNISMAKAKTLPLPQTPISMQEQFTEIATQFGFMREKQTEALRQADHLFKSLLAGAFEGYRSG